jgi:hypothetical protein
MTGADQRGQADSQERFTQAEPPGLVFEVLIVGGAEGRRLAAEQARAIREVIEWLARRQSSNGQDRAA